MEKIYELNLPEVQIVDEVHLDDEHVHITSTQNCTEIIEANRAAYNAAGNHPRWGDGRVVGRIPMVLYYELKEKGILTDSKRLRQWMNDPDNLVFRTMPGT